MCSVSVCRETTRAGMVHQVGEQPVLVAGERNGGATHGDLRAGRIERHIAAPQFGLRVAMGATNERPDSREYLLDAVRLGQVIVRPAVDAEHALGPAAARGEHEDGYVQSCFTPRAQQGESVDAGEPEVQQDRIVRLGPRQEVGARHHRRRSRPHTRPR